jgi:hypothetical protein
MIITKPKRHAVDGTRVEDFASHEQRAHTMVSRLETVSHGTVGKIGSEHVGPGDDPPLFPPGGASWRDDVVGIVEILSEEGFHQVSHVPFRAALRECETEADFAEVADLTEKALASWRRTKRPPRDSEAWRRMVANEPGTVRAIADDWGISPAYVHQLRQQYRTAA